jgi:hypothetical protein
VACGTGGGAPENEMNKSFFILFSKKNRFLSLAFLISSLT